MINKKAYETEKKEKKKIFYSEESMIQYEKSLETIVEQLLLSIFQVNIPDEKLEVDLLSVPLTFRARNPRLLISDIINNFTIPQRR